MTNEKRNEPEHRRAVCDPPELKLKTLGITVTLLTPRETAVLALSDFTGKRLILNHNLHSAYLHGKDDKFRQLYENADWTVIDGIPILWAASVAAHKVLPSNYRFSSTDWIDELSHVQCPARIFVFGATLTSNCAAIEKLRTKLPNCAVSGVHGYVNDQLAIEMISDFRPNLVVVGLGMPRQEYFLLKNWARLPSATYATVGGAIDYIAGTTRLAPRWLGYFGAEWLWRLLNEPRRLAFRYLVEPWLLAWQILVRSVHSVRT